MFDNEGSKRITFPTSSAPTAVDADGVAPGAAATSSNDGEASSGDYSGVPGVMRNVDAWFEREATTIRREAAR